MICALWFVLIFIVVFLFATSGPKMTKVDNSEKEQQILELSEKVLLDVTCLSPISVLLISIVIVFFIFVPLLSFSFISDIS